MPVALFWSWLTLYQPLKINRHIQRFFLCVSEPLRPSQILPRGICAVLEQAGFCAGGELSHYALDVWIEVMKSVVSIASDHVHARIFIHMPHGDKKTKVIATLNAVQIPTRLRAAQTGFAILHALISLGLPAFSCRW
jgi:hypothetical protein